MKSIKDKTIYEFEVKHSTFITYLLPADEVKTVKQELETIKAEHPGANHHCYAYVLGDNQEIQKADDDGEPSQTAGIPILEVFKKNAITNVLCVVVRYFGGVKLGAGGLIRAYSKGASEALKKAVLTKKQAYVTLRLRVDFNQIGIMEHLISEHATLLERDYSDKADFTVVIRKEQQTTFESLIIEQTKNRATITHLKTEELYH